MGTVVLSPQDCLSSSPSRQSYCFSSMASTSSRESFQARVSSSSPAKDCVRKHSSGGSPPGDGILPVPQPHGQARALLKKSSASESLSSFHTPPPRRSFFTPKSKLARSRSAISPTPLSGSPPLSDRDTLLLVEGRLPFKVVQGNGPGSPGLGSLHVAKKSADKCGAHKRNPEKCGEKVKEHFECPEGLKSSVKKDCVEVVTRKQVKQRVRRQGCPDKSQSGKDFGDSCKQSANPVVTILQRPKNNEAAAELIAKYFKKSDEQSPLCVNYEAPSMAQKHDLVVTGSETESSGSGMSDSEGSDTSASHSSSSLHILRANTNKDMEVPSTNLPTASDMGIQEPSDVTEAKSLIPTGSGCDDLTLWERWAGPCYVNSPPPSALPLPRFSKKHTDMRWGPLVPTPLFKETVSDEASTVMTPTSTVLCGSLGDQDLAIEFDAFATATKDLKRILNLDNYSFRI